MARGGKIKFEFLVLNFKFIFPVTAVKIVLAGFLEKEKGQNLQISVQLTIFYLLSFKKWT